MFCQCKASEQKTHQTTFSHLPEIIISSGKTKALSATFIRSSHSVPVFLDLRRGEMSNRINQSDHKLLLLSAANHKNEVEDFLKTI